MTYVDLWSLGRLS